MKATKDRLNPSQTNDSLKNPYRGPKIVDVGTVEELTHGSGMETSDEPNSGFAFA
jgi:hypothetical protein